MLRGLFVAILTLASLAYARERPIVAGYVPLWSNLQTVADNVDFQKLTHINIAFLNPADETGTLKLDGKVAPFIAAAHRYGVKVIVSIGGGGASEDAAMRERYAVLLSAERREAFAAMLVEFAGEHGFDGVDVDLEGPAITDAYGPFIAVLSTALKSRGLLLTAALSKGYGGDHVPRSAFAHFDFVHIMAYDATGPWAPGKPGQHSSLRFAHENVEWWLAHGVKPSQATLGLPFYGYAFGADAAKRREFNFGEITARWPGAAQRDESGSTVFYNGIPTIQAKCRLALEKELAGVMIWHIAGDAKGADSLLQATHEMLGGASR